MGTDRAGGSPPPRSGIAATESFVDGRGKFLREDARSISLARWVGDMDRGRIYVGARFASSRRGRPHAYAGEGLAEGLRGFLGFRGAEERVA